ncbi:F0F1 ATP synthase subunit epsilon [Yunchengibacter salinarum]|uniref:F0F1 ATP synthase subunit epsilon n=1 Tax=Yunchengibacter salinarum TaxID=3133399 RepID=UPI0035B691FF
MADSFAFELVSPDRLEKTGSATEIVVPGMDGDFGVLADHAPLMSTLRPGVLTVLEEDGSEGTLFVKGGLAQVTPEGLTILAESIIDPASVDSADLDKQISNTREDIADARDVVEADRLTKDLTWMEALREVV